MGRRATGQAFADYEPAIHRGLHIPIVGRSRRYDIWKVEAHPETPMFAARHGDRGERDC